MASIFEFSEHVYNIDPADHTLNWRQADISLVDHASADSVSLFPVWTQGIRRHDLAIFGTRMDDCGIEELGLLVVRSSQNQGLLATPEAIELDQGHLITPELAKKFATVTAEEIAQLGIQRIARMTEKKYPTMRGFTR